MPQPTHNQPFLTFFGLIFDFLPAFNKYSWLKTHPEARLQISRYSETWLPIFNSNQLGKKSEKVQLWKCNYKNALSGWSGLSENDFFASWGRSSAVAVHFCACNAVFEMHWRGKDYNAGNSTDVYYTLYYGSRVQICRFINKTSQPHCQPARPLQLNLMVV